ncbi:30S ribosomal protein S1 [Buchnera aphidicola]|uniref:30S ribosomal protein S1 n=1 Tax=Buchnera aphidicola (Stegophylla sp.) TaxID=2315800 RepID=A0A4D6YKJ9_9GAMM|nr:30S ribosomal protein S1 [Buchnera aphidicola (Stegophylla sp.)]
MNETFSELFEESLSTLNTKPGSIISGIVLNIEKDMVLIDSGLKSESYIPIEQFQDNQGKLEINIGDCVDVSLDAIEDGFGTTILSREKAKRYESWLELKKIHKNSETITGIISSKVKGGFTVELNNIRAFLPGSLVDIRPIRDTNYLEGQKLEFKVIKLDQKRNNVVVSRRAVIESTHSAEREQLLSNLQEGLKIQGIVKNLTDYGAFIDLGGVDGLLHITDMAWKRVKHPSEMISIGDEICVKVLKFDRDKTRVSLGLKQLNEDPWMYIDKKYPEGKIVHGRITNLTDYGCFVEIQEGIEGLVHVSEMDWTNKNIHPSKIAKIEDMIQVMILDIDKERRRISLGIKQCQPNPWKIFEKKYATGIKVTGKIKSITDFGIFIGLEGGIDGLIHLSDIEWDRSNEKVLIKYKKGDEISAVILQIDSDRERISLGIKQLHSDPLHAYMNTHKKNSIISGKILSISNNTLHLKLSKNIIGILNMNSVLKQYKIKNIVKIFNINNILQCRIDNCDYNNRVVNVSVKKNFIKNHINRYIQQIKENKNLLLNITNMSFNTT